jgi:transposase
VDLLPDPEAPTLATWLREHPGVEMVSRARAGSSAEGVRQGAPDAQQIADRWQRLSNLSEAMKGFFLNTQAQLKALVYKPSAHVSQEEAEQLAPWQTGMRK